MPLEHIDPPTLMKPMGYTHVVAATGARTLYVAGQGAFDAQWQLVGPGTLFPYTTLFRSRKSVV